MNLPKRVEIVEVCPRDGFQNVKDFITTENKIKIIKTLINAGFKRLEITSFVSPKAIPQTRDAKDVVAAIKSYTADKDVSLIGLVPNETGLRAAVEAGVDQITYVISVSEKHNKANVNRSVAESMEQYETLIKEYRGAIDFRLGLATTFGCPFGDIIELDNIRKMCNWAFDLGTKEILMADTVGLGNPRIIEEVMRVLVKDFGEERFIMHLHNTRGMALANILVALNNGITKYESAAGGLGGCPFAPGAAGNVATEDLNNMLKEMGITTDIDMKVLGEAISLIESHVNARIVSHMSHFYKNGSCEH